MDNYISVHQLKTTYDLFSEKNRELKDEIGNLHIEDVKDNRLDATIKRIKRQILLYPVVFKEPKIIDHQQSQKNERPNYNNPFGGNVTVNNVMVEFPFEGSPDIFGYNPSSGFHYSDPVVYLPDSNNTVVIKVETHKLDKDAVLNEARGKMQTTFNIISPVNAEVKAWTERTEPGIEDMIKQKKEELLKFYS